MEEEPEKGGSYPWFLCDSLLQYGRHSLVSLRACQPVVVCRKTWDWSTSDWRVVGSLVVVTRTRREEGKGATEVEGSNEDCTEDCVD
jgi:dihydrofolate reductase